MNIDERLDWIKRYVTLLLLVAIISLILIVGGFYFGGVLIANRLFVEGADGVRILKEAGLGSALQALGVLVWVTGSVMALYSVLYDQFSAMLSRNLANKDIEASLKNIVGNRTDDIQTEFAEIRRTLEQQDRNRDRNRDD